MSSIFKDLYLDKITEIYDNTLTDILNKHAPTLNKTIRARPNNPWYTTHLHQMKNEKRKFEYNQTKQNTDWLKYKQFCNNNTYECFKTKTNYICNIIQGSAADPKKMHSIINDLSYSETSVLYVEKKFQFSVKKLVIFSTQK